MQKSADPRDPSVFMRVKTLTQSCDPNKKEAKIMDSKQRTDTHLASLQSRLERELGINPDNSDALELLWEVQRERAANLYAPQQTQPAQRQLEIYGN